MIIGKNIRLRAIERDDIPRFVEWLNDPEVIAGLLINIPMSSWDETKWFEKLADLSPEKRPLAIDVRLGDDQWLHVGNIGLEMIEWTNRQAEFGIFIGRKEYWNKGIGYKAIELILKHGFETLNLNRIYLKVYETNLPAIHLYKKLGFILEGKLRQSLYQNNQYFDIFIMSMLHSEWNTKTTE